MVFGLYCASCHTISFFFSIYLEIVVDVVVLVK